MVSPKTVQMVTKKIFENLGKQPLVEAKNKVRFHAESYRRHPRLPLHNFRRDQYKQDMLDNYFGALDAVINGGKVPLPYDPSRREAIYV